MFFNDRFYARLNHAPLRSLNDGAEKEREREGMPCSEQEGIRNSERRGEIFTRERDERMASDEREGKTNVNRRTSIRA